MFIIMSTHNPIISSREIARLIDISAVRADSTRQDVEDIIDGAIKHNFICVSHARHASARF